MDDTAKISLVVISIIFTFVSLEVLPFMLRVLAETWDYALFGNWI